MNAPDSELATEIAALLAIAAMVAGANAVLGIPLLTAMLGEYGSPLLVRHENHGQFGMLALVTGPCLLAAGGVYAAVPVFRFLPWLILSAIWSASCAAVGLAVLSVEGFEPRDSVMVAFALSCIGQFAIGGLFSAFFAAFRRRGM